MKNLGLYIHIPFCVKKCNYCDFLSFAPYRVDEYVKALTKEIKEFNMTGYKVDSVFFGGGTPSILSVKDMDRIFIELRKKFDIEENAEITIEINPKTFDEEKLKAYRGFGINRLSIGVQSTDNKLLKELGRIHKYEEFLTGYYMARDIGFNNINIDLMAGLPKQSLENYHKNVYDILELEPEHISSYGLIIEEDTPFFEKYSEGAYLEQDLPKEDILISMYEDINSILKGKYERYEISNYAKKGYECKHNLKYWNRQEYKGFGLGASSYLVTDIAEERKKNTVDFSSYIEGINEVEVEKLSMKDILNETIFLELRKTEGIDLVRFNKRYGYDIDSLLKNKLDKFAFDGYIKKSDKYIYLTQKGMEISNYIMSELMLESEVI